MCVFISRNDRIDGQKLFKEKDGSFIRLSAGWGSYFKWSFPKTDQVVLVLFFFLEHVPRSEDLLCRVQPDISLTWQTQRIRHNDWSFYPMRFGGQQPAAHLERFMTSRQKHKLVRFPPPPPTQKHPQNPLTFPTVTMQTNGKNGVVVSMRLFRTKDSLVSSYIQFLMSLFVYILASGSWLACSSRCHYVGHGRRHALIGLEWLASTGMAELWTGIFKCNTTQYCSRPMMCSLMLDVMTSYHCKK